MLQPPPAIAHVKHRETDLEGHGCQARRGNLAKLNRTVRGSLCRCRPVRQFRRKPSPNFLRETMIKQLAAGPIIVLIGTLSLTKYLIFQKIKPPKSCLFSGLFRERVSS